MEYISHKELDHRIHTFLDRKFAELETLERIPRINAWRGRPHKRHTVAEHWGHA